jgi:hypothetical protein
MKPSDIIHSDLEVDYINSLLPGEVIHRNVDIPIVQADIEGEIISNFLTKPQVAQCLLGYVRSYIVMPSFIHGPLKNKIFEAGIQNPDRSSALWVKMALDYGGPRVIGTGKNYWGFVDNASRVCFFISFC